MCFSATNLNAQSILISIPDTTGVNGNTIDIPINIDSSVTGKNVLSYQLKITYSTSYVNLVNVISTGTMSSGFATPTYNTTNGTLTISSAGTSALAGKGVLLYLRFQMIQSGYEYLYFSGVNDCYFNQGSPAMTFKSGSINISNPPTITASFSSNNPLTIGDSVQVYVSGGTSPYVYKVMDSTVATITTSGMLKAIGVGFTKVRAQSADSLVDTTNTSIEVRALRVSIPDTTILPLSNIVYPIQINSTNSSSIISGSIRINYTQNYLVPDSIITTGTLLQNATVSYQNYSSYTIISFATSTALTGAGDLIKIRFKILNPQNSYLYLQDILFNQSTLANSKNGSIFYTPITALNVSPTYGEFFTGDAQQFSPSGGKSPYVFSVSDTSHGSISANGLFVAKAGGFVKVNVTDSLNSTIQTNALQVYDAQLSLPTLSALGSSFVTLPIFISKQTGAKDFYSLQFTISYPSGTLDSIQIVLTNSLASNWTVSQNVMSDKMIIAIVGTSPITSNGILFRLKAKVTPSTSVGSSIYLNASNVLFNEGGYVGKVVNGNISIVNVLQKDIGISSIPSSSSTCTKSSQETISATIYNYNNVTYFMGDTIFVGYKLNANTPIKDTIVLTSNLSQYSSFIYTFKKLANMSSVGTYTLKVYTVMAGDINSANDTNVSTFQVYGNPVVNLGNDTAFCLGNAKVLDATNTSCYYLWNTNATSPTISVSSSGQYWVKVTSYTNCFTADTINITVNSGPTVSKLTGVGYTTVCGLDSILLSTTSSGTNKYRWLLNGSNTNNSSDTLNHFTVKNSGTYTVRVTNASGCSSLMTDTTISLAGSRQTAPLITGYNSICAGDTIKLSASTLTGISYRWYGPNGFTASTQNISISNYSFSSGTYNVYAIKNSAANTCDTSTVNSISISIHAKPVSQSLGVMGSLSFCSGDSVILSTLSGSKYRWTINGNSTSNNGDTLNTIIVKAPGTYNVKVNNGFGCVAMMHDTLVTTYLKPATSSIAGNSTVTIGTTQTYNVTNTSGSTYNWLVNNGSITTGSGTNSINIQWSNTVGSGYVKVIETNTNSCKGDTISKIVTITNTVIPDSLSLNTDTIHSPMAGNVSTVNITSNRSWTISSNQTWASSNSTSGTGNGSFSVTTNTNNTGADRNAIITVTAGTIVKTVYIKQITSASIPDSLGLNIDTIHSPYVGNSTTINVTSNRSWTVSSNQTWASSNSTSGSGNGSFSVTTTTNNTGADRNAIITVTTGAIVKTIYVQQLKSASIPDSLALNIDTIHSPYAGNSTTINVTSNRSWTVSSNQTWASSNSISGTGNGSFSVTTTSNTGVDRNATITVTAGSLVKTVYVIQLQKSSGINTVSSTDEQLKVYPNPTDGIIYLQTSNEQLATTSEYKIAIYNLVGEKIYQSTIINQQSAIDLSTQPKGIYFIQITNGNSVVNRKIVLQ